MTILNVEINSMNQALTDEGAAAELARILRKLAQDIEAEPAGPMQTVTLRDYNGNKAGRAAWRIDAEED